MESHRVSIKKTYHSLNELQQTFNLRTIRNIIIKQTAPKEDDGDSSVFEIFNRLNTGGVNLRPQEIRASLFYSDFFEMLERVNLNPEWRRLLNLAEPDVHSKDIEILLRALALLLKGDDYKEPMSKFLNIFAKRARKWSAKQIETQEALFSAFFKATRALAADAFSAQSGRFNIATFEAVFAASCVGRAQIPGRQYQN